MEFLKPACGIWQNFLRKTVGPTADDTVNMATIHHSKLIITFKSDCLWLYKYVLGLWYTLSDLQCK